MATIIIDGQSYQVNPDNNLLQECLSNGLDLPYFCWHPCMGSVGACRQCAVKQYRDEDDENGMLVMACMTPATDGSIISIEDTQAREFRARVIESLMISHPHDCPVCEEGGECHLQDMTLMSGHNYRRYDKNKVTHRNQYLGPFINHEMNRCIACYRCVRFYNDYAGGTDLAAQASHHHVYFGRHRDGVLENEFSGNLVEVCPTGVFTDKHFSAHYSRKWDLQTAPSVCGGCAVGCNITPGERYGELRRIVNRYNNEINGYFICDRGRFGFDYINSDERLITALAANDQGVNELGVKEAANELEKLRNDKLIGIASPRASNESNYALRCFVGAENFYSGQSEEEHESTQLHLRLARDPAFHIPSIKEVETCDAILILGEDVTNTAPRVALALRQAVRNRARELAFKNRIPQWQDAAVRELAQHELSPLYRLSPYATRLDDITRDGVIAGPQELVDLSLSLCAVMRGEQGSELVGEIVSVLQGAKRPVIVCGSQNGPELIKAAANIARALEQKRGAGPVDLLICAAEVNSLGHGLLVDENRPLSAALQRMQQEGCHAIVLENDLYRRAPSEQINTAFQGQGKVVVLDQLDTDTVARADLVLPVTAFTEQECTWVNYEGRAQLSFQVHRNHNDAQPAWRWLGQSDALTAESWVKRCADELQGFTDLDKLLPDVKDFIAGMKVPRQSHRYSGRTAMKSHLNVHEPKQAVDAGSVFSFSMEGMPFEKNSSLLSAAWAPKWNSNQAISKFQDEINGELKQGSTGNLLLSKDKQKGSDFEIDKTAVKSEGLEVVLAKQIFGSDELSARSSAIRQRMTDAYVGLSPHDAERLGLNHGATVSLNDSDAVAVVCVRTHVKTGTAVIYTGENLINPHDLGLRVTIKASDGVAGERGIRGLIVSDLVAGG